MFEDIKQGVQRIKKIKSDQKGNNNYKNGGGNFKYSLDKPPQIFIRKAVESEGE